MLNNSKLQQQIQSHIQLIYSKTYYRLYRPETLYRRQCSGSDSKKNQYQQENMKEKY